MPGSRISIIVPALDDGPAVARLVTQIRSQAAQPLEIIVVSAGTNAELERQCLSSGCRYLECILNRGAQLDAGARAAAGDIMWFLHADAEPHSDSLEAMGRAVDDGATGGHFRFRLGGKPAAWKVLVSALTNLRSRLGGIPYGDQGLFVTRDAYAATGGFERQPLFEEVRFVRKLRHHGHFRALPLPIDVAPRRWERDGWIWRSLGNRILALRYATGAPAETLAANYEGTRVRERKATQ